MRKWLNLVFVTVMALGVMVGIAEAKQRFEFGPYKYDDYAAGTPDWYPKYSAEPRVRYYAPGGTDPDGGWTSYWRYWYYPYDWSSSANGILFNSGFGISSTYYLGARAEMPFFGTGVDLVWPVHHGTHNIAVYVDNVYYTTIDTYWNPPEPQTVTRIVRGLPNTAHILKCVSVENLTSPAGHGFYDRNMMLDAADIYTPEDDAALAAFDFLDTNNDGVLNDADKVALIGPQGPPGSAGATGPEGPQGEPGLYQPEIIDDLLGMLHDVDNAQGGHLHPRGKTEGWIPYGTVLP